MAPEQILHDVSSSSATVTERIKALLEQLSAYIEHYHRGWVDFVDFDGRVVIVRLGGACETCNLQTHTLHGWVEGTLRQFFPEIERVEAVDQNCLPSK